MNVHIDKLHVEHLYIDGSVPAGLVRRRVVGATRSAAHKHGEMDATTHHPGRDGADHHGQPPQRLVDLGLQVR